MGSDKDKCMSFNTQEPFTTRVSKQRKIKSVHFADTKGLALTSTFFFAKEHFSPQDNRGRIIANFYQSNRKINGECAKLLNFKSPVCPKDLTDNLDNNNVCLEKTYCNRNGIYGRIQVKNIAFEKDVFVRYTFDSWQTWQDQKANHIPGSSTLETDTFFFHIKSPRSSEDKKMEFAICYKVNERQFWENNFGDNYRLIYSHS